MMDWMKKYKYEIATFNFNECSLFSGDLLKFSFDWTCRLKDYFVSIMPYLFKIIYEGPKVQFWTIRLLGDIVSWLLLIIHYLLENLLNFVNFIIAGPQLLYNDKLDFPKPNYLLMNPLSSFDVVY